MILWAIQFIVNVDEFESTADTTSLVKKIILSLKSEQSAHDCNSQFKKPFLGNKR